MQILNLIKPGNGIDYKIYSFPDGEKQLHITGELDHKQDAKIICRITNGDDLFLLLQAADILTAHGIDFTTDIKYLMSARTDRRFDMGRPLSFKIVADILNTIPGTKNILEIHNPNKHYINNVGNYIHGDVYVTGYETCFPDAGAAARYINKSSLLCSKERNEDGSLVGFKLDNPYDYNGDPIVVIDDLCDAGGTFIGIAELLRKELNPPKLALKVTHAIQAKGIEIVANMYDEVFITNSYLDWENWEKLPSNVKVTDVCSA